MARAWLRWREDNPGWQAPPALDDEGKPKSRRNGQAILICPAYPLKMPHPEHPEKEISFATWLYHVGRKVAPELASCLVSTMSREVVARLAASMPYNHTGKAKQRWEAILNNEVNLESYRSLTIPVPNNSAGLFYCGAASNEDMSGKVKSRFERHGMSGCVAGFPLHSGKSREWPVQVVSLLVRQLSAGHRSLIRRVVSGAWKFSDSELVFVEGRGWQFHLTYSQPDDSIPKVEGDRVATLVCEKEGDYPFTVTRQPWPEEIARGSKPVSWRIGHGPMFIREFSRLNARRRHMRTDYGTSGHGRKGHGRQRNERDIRETTRQVQNLVNRMTDISAAEIGKFCEKHGCSVLEWSEPSVKSRASLWFGVNKVQWDWTLFIAKLSHQCRKRGITLREPEQPSIKMPKPKKGKPPASETA